MKDESPKINVLAMVSGVDVPFFMDCRSLFVYEVNSNHWNALR